MFWLKDLLFFSIRLLRLPKSSSKSHAFWDSMYYFNFTPPPPPLDKITWERVGGMSRRNGWCITYMATPPPPGTPTDHFDSPSRAVFNLSLCSIWFLLNIVCVVAVYGLYTEVNSSIRRRNDVTALPFKSLHLDSNIH